MMILDSSVSRYPQARRLDGEDILIANPTADRGTTPAHAGDHATREAFSPWPLPVGGVHGYRLRATGLRRGYYSSRPARAFGRRPVHVYRGGRSDLVARSRLKGRCEIGDLSVSRGSSARGGSDVDGRGTTRHVQEGWLVIEEGKVGVVKVGFEQG